MQQDAFVAVDGASELEAGAKHAREGYEAQIRNLDEQTERHLKQLEQELQTELTVFESSVQERMTRRVDNCKKCRDCDNCREEGRCFECEGCGDPDCERDKRRREREEARKDLVSQREQ